MNKISTYLSMLVFLAIGFNASAQIKFSMGVKAGPNFATINSQRDATTNYDNRTGFHAGAFALFKGEKVGIQPELIFSQQGSKFNYIGSPGSPDLRANFSYLNVPIIVKLYTVAGINIQVGPQIGFLTSAKEENFDVSNGITEQNIKNDIHKTDLTLALGLGWDLPVGVTIDARYNWGLSDVRSGAGATQRNQVWQFSIGYKLFTLGE